MVNSASAIYYRKKTQKSCKKRSVKGKKNKIWLSTEKNITKG